MDTDQMDIVTEMDTGSEIDEVQLAHEQAFPVRIPAKRQRRAKSTQQERGFAEEGVY
jgi:hypothetical protein